MLCCCTHVHSCPCLLRARCSSLGCCWLPPGVAHLWHAFHGCRGCWECPTAQPLPVICAIAVMQAMNAHASALQVAQPLVMQAPAAWHLVYVRPGVMRPAGACTCVFASGGRCSAMLHNLFRAVVQVLHGCLGRTCYTVLACVSLLLCVATVCRGGGWCPW